MSADAGEIAKERNFKPSMGRAFESADAFRRSLNELSPTLPPLVAGAAAPGHGFFGWLEYPRQRGFQRLSGAARRSSGLFKKK
ncbi:MAG: hypothetical protein H7A48_01090 [Akkermansiaceae bacterium]|nr:hypothetical protein [Akkermansiaceae bacterium]